MVRNYGDFLYKEIKRRGLTDLFKNKKDVSNNLAVLENIVVNMNVTKSTLADIDNEYPGTILYLKYLLQHNHNINFGICEYFKVWENREGWQYRCRLDKGKGRRIQVWCYGNLTKCERKR